MTRRNWIPDIHDTILESLHAKWRLDDHEMAQRMEFDLQTIKRHRTRMGLKPNTRSRSPSVVAHQKEGPKPSHRANPLNEAALALGRRLQEKNGTYWLDGCPVNLDTIMRETNRIRVNMGQEQITTCERWRV